MENTRLVYFLRRLSAEELDGFGHYIRSPLFNERETVVKLYEVLRTSLIDGQENITREEVYAMIYPGQSLKLGSLKALFSKLFGLLKEFLIFLELKEWPLLQNRLFLSRINDLNVSFFPVFYKSFQEALAKSGINAVQLHLERFHLEEEWDRYQMRQGKRQERGLMEPAVRFIGVMYVLCLLRYSLRRCSFSQTYDHPTTYFLEVPVFQFLDEQVASLPKVVQAYYSLLQIQNLPQTEARFSGLRELLSENEEAIPRRDLHEIYTYTLNEGIRRITKGQTEMQADVFDIYKEMLDLKFLGENGAIMVHHFRNIVGLALKIKDIKWTTQFLKRWEGRIQGDYAQNAFYFNRGALAFCQGDYAEAETCFNHILNDFQDIFYSLNARGMLLMVYYETQNETGMDALLGSYRMYLHRLKGLATSRKQSYIHFANHFRRLVSCSPGEDKRLLRLKNDIEDKKPTGLGKEWLLEKIDALMGKEED